MKVLKDKKPWVKVVLGCFHYNDGLNEYYVVSSKKCPLPLMGVKEDMGLFRNVTKDAVVIMGSVTWKSLPKKPLDNRINVIISTKNSKHLLSESELLNPNILHVNNVTKPDEFLQYLHDRYNKPIVIIGGLKTFELFNEEVDEMIISNVHVYDIGLENKIGLMNAIKVNDTLDKWTYSLAKEKVKVPTLNEEHYLACTHIITDKGKGRLYKDLTGKEMTYSSLMTNLYHDVFGNIYATNT